MLFRFAPTHIGRGIDGVYRWVSNPEPNSQNVSIEPVEATGTGSVVNSSPVVIQVPRQPKQDDGKWMLIGSLLGSILGNYANESMIKKAKAAEDTWNVLNKQLHDKGNEIWNRMPEAMDKANKADDDLEKHHQWNTELSDSEKARAEKLDGCNDSLHEKICQFAQCGYVPDYDGIKARIMADVAGVTKKKREELCKNLNRYSVRQCCGIETALATSAISTTVSALYKAREDERARAWQINEGLLFKAAEMMERDRSNRLKDAMTARNTAVSIQKDRYNNHNNNYLNFAKLGGEFLSAAGRNYAWLADSYRKTAEKGKLSLAQLGGLLGVVAYVLKNAVSEEDNKACKKEEEGQAHSGVVDKLFEGLF